MKKKVCRKCKLFVEGNECTICKSTEFTTTWMGRITIMDPDKSEIAKKLDIKIAGNYAIKAR